MKRGGKREGAGRKAPDGARVTLNARVKAETREALDRLRGDIPLGRYLDILAQEKMEV